MRDADWLKGIMEFIMVGILTNACPLEEIRTAAEKDCEREACGVFRWKMEEKER